MRLSKYCPLILILLIGLIVGCSRDRVIDEVFRWAPSGVPEADSLLLEFERRSLEMDTPMRSYKNLELRTCTLATKYPENKLVQSRAKYIQYTLLGNTEITEDSLLHLIASEKAKLDSASHAYDWHLWTAFEIDIETNMMRKYLKATDNLLFFEKTGALYEAGRAHLQLGNIMQIYSDYPQAKAHYQHAYEIFLNYNQNKNMLICQFNLANTAPKEEKDSIYLKLLNDSAARKFGQLQIWVMHNYVLSTGNVEYIDSALLIADNPAYFSDYKKIKEVPFLYALKGNFYDQEKRKHKFGKDLILRGFDSINKNTSSTHYKFMMYRMLGAAYGNMQQDDSAAYYFYQSILWQDSLKRELQQSQVSGIDVKKRIELERENIRHQRDIWIWGFITTLIVTILFTIIIVVNHKRRHALKEYKQLLVKQQLQKSVQSVKIQTMVIEENEKLIDEISDQINQLRQNGEIDMASAGALTRIMKLHKTDSDAHKSLLEVQKELGNDFINKLKEDYPFLSEGQIKLASLIAIGVESPQICRILGIQLSSLHKSRYRLRTRLGLNNDDSLEEFLRNRNRNAI